MWMVLDLIKAKFVDGLVLSGDSCEEIMKKLWDSARFDDSDNLEEYMRKVAERAALQTGSQVAYDSPDSLVAELYRVGIIKTLERGAIN